jgi:WD40 repeat protein
MRLWDLDSGRCLHRYACNSGSRFSNEVPVSLAANRAFSHAPRSQHAVWDLAGGDCTALISFDPYPGVSAMSTDGRQVLCHHGVQAGADPVSRLCIWDLDSLTLATVLLPYPDQQAGHDAYPAALALSPCGRYAAAGRRNGDIHLWERASGRHLRVLELHAKQVNSLGFSSDGAHLLSTSSDSRICLWDAGSGACLRVIDAHPVDAMDAVLDPGLAQPLFPCVENDDMLVTDLSDGARAVKVALAVPPSVAA